MHCRAHLAHGLRVGGAGGEVAPRVQAPKQAAPAVVPRGRVGQAPGHQRLPLQVRQGCPVRRTASTPHVHWATGSAAPTGARCHTREHARSSPSGRMREAPRPRPPGTRCAAENPAQGVPAVAGGRSPARLEDRALRLHGHDLLQHAPVRARHALRARSRAPLSRRPSAAGAAAPETACSGTAAAAPGHVILLPSRTRKQRQSGGLESGGGRSPRLGDAAAALQVQLVHLLADVVV